MFRKCNLTPFSPFHISNIILQNNLPMVNTLPLLLQFSKEYVQNISPSLFFPSRFQKRSFDEVSCSICVQKGHVSSKNCFGWLVKNTKYSAFIQLWPQTLVSSLKICCCRKMREIWHRGVLLTQGIWCGFLWPYLILVFIFYLIEWTVPMQFSHLYDDVSFMWQEIYPSSVKANWKSVRGGKSSMWRKSQANM